MFVAYVVYNLDDGNDLNMIGCSDTPQGAINLLNKRADTEEDKFGDEWDNSNLNASQTTADDG